MSYGPWHSEFGGYRAKMSELENFITSNGSMAAPGGMRNLKEFKEQRGSDSTILYWQFTRVGPGVHKTTYTIWNE